MIVNPKKPITLVSNTKHFDPARTRIKNTFSSPNTKQNRDLKIEGYETRLYWQYRYCDEHSGQTFFYTLTYNDRSMPHFLGQNCFDYEDLRDLLTGGFRKQLLRKYGTTFKYFVGAELGDGKGERGLHNNPHYHVLFFLEPANNPRYPYIQISPRDFRHLIRLYWQGFDEDEDKKLGIFHKYTEAKYGIAREGEPVGVRQPVFGKVIDFRACCYVSKYVTKDATLKENERKFYSRFVTDCNERLYDLEYAEEYYKRFFDEYIWSKYAVDITTGEEMFEDVYDFVAWLGDEYYAEYNSPLPIDLTPFRIRCPFTYFNLVPELISILGLYHIYEKYARLVVEEYCHDRLTEYRNRYCNKCRISQGVGDYALSFINDKMEPLIKVPGKNGFKPRPLSMYYFRKLFTTVVKDESGNPIRILTPLGIKYKLYHLPKQIDKLVARIAGYYPFLSDPEFFDKIVKSDVNEDVTYTFEGFFDIMNYLLENNKIEEIFKRYAEYKLVYENRFFPFDLEGRDGNPTFPPIDLMADYERFLQPTVLDTPRDDYRLARFLEDGCPGYMAYGSHPYFLRFVGVFSVFDLVADYLFVSTDDKKQKDAEEVAAVKRFHSTERVKDFYKNFGL